MHMDLFIFHMGTLEDTESKQNDFKTQALIVFNCSVFLLW